MSKGGSEIISRICFLNPSKSGYVVGSPNPHLCWIRRLPRRDDSGKAAGGHDRRVRGARHGLAHPHCRRQLRRLLPGAEEDRGAGAEGGGQGIFCFPKDHSLEIFALQAEEREWEAKNNEVR